MNWFQRFAVRLAARIAPPLGRVLATTGGTVDKLSEQIDLYRERYNMARDVREEARAELVEAVALANGGPWQHGLTEAKSRESATPLREALAELELALEDRGWKRQLAMADTEFSRYGIQQIILISRLYFIKNPLIRRGVKVSAMYVFGRGVEISCGDTGADKVLQAFFSDQQNMQEWSHSGMVQKEESFYTDGNLFLAFFTSIDDGSTVIRTIDATEIEKKITDPDDASIPWFYKRRWTHFDFDAQTGVQTPHFEEQWYVDIDYTPPAGMNTNTVEGKPLMRDKTGQLIPLMHIKVGALPKWHFGCPLVYAALDWARAYRHFLEDWCTITRALARFAWQVETQGGAPAIAAFKAQLATTLGQDGYSIETNPTPTVGSAFITGPGNKLTPVKTSQSTSDPEQGRRVLLMVASAFGLPETFFGDASTGSLATAQSLDRPTELQFLQRQEAWREIFQRIGRYVLERSAGAPKGKLKEASKDTSKLTIDVKFPSVLEHDISAAVTAIVTAMTLNGFEVSGIDEKVGVGLLLQELGVENVQTVIEAMYPDDEYDPDRTVEDEPPLPATSMAPGAPGAPASPGQPGQPAQTQQPAQQQGAPPQGPKPKTPKPKRKTASEAQLIAATVELRRALQKLKEKKLV